MNKWVWCPQQRSKIYWKLQTNIDDSLDLLPHHDRNAHDPQHIETNWRDVWSPSIAKARHETETIVSWHKIGKSKLEEAHGTTDVYNCGSWKQGSPLLSQVQLQPPEGIKHVVWTKGVQFLARTEALFLQPSPVSASCEWRWCWAEIIRPATSGEPNVPVPHGVTLLER